MVKASCQVCEKGKAEGLKLSFCSCRSVIYCSRACQKVDWKTHKVICKKLSRAEKAKKLAKRGSLMMLDTALFRDHVCSFLDKASIVELLKVKELSDHFQLRKYFCDLHGSKLEKVTKREKKDFFRRQEDDGHGLASSNPGCPDCSMAAIGRECCGKCGDFDKWNKFGDCEKCGLHACYDCFIGCRCEKCGKGEYCIDCFEGYICGDGCGETYCYDCGLLAFCEICHKGGCCECMEDIFICDSCKGSFCIECRDGFYCDICEDWFCNDCEVFAFCEICKKGGCCDCMEDVDICDICKGSFCFECRDSFTCDICKGNFCLGECKDGFYCEICEDGFCAECKDCFRCECGTAFCLDCVSKDKNKRACHDDCKENSAKPSKPSSSDAKTRQS
jgi:hypothetical protein